MRRLALIAPLVMAAAAEAGPGFWLVGLAPETKDGLVAALSKDGSVAVGLNGNGKMTPGFSWTSSGGRIDFGLEQGMPPHSGAFGVSSDGGVIVGNLAYPIDEPPYLYQHAYRRVGNGALEDLGVLPLEARSFARGVSGDGAIVVGSSEHGDWSDAYGEAFRWTAQTGMQGLGYLKAGGTHSKAYAISRDGTSIVGSSQSGGVIGPQDAYMWTESTGMKELPGFDDEAQAFSSARGVNADGTVAVGAAYDSQNVERAVRWVNGALQNLSGDLNTDAFASAVDDSGNIVGGRWVGGGSTVAFVWTPATGLIDLDDYLYAHGIEIPPDFRLEEVRAISGDGFTFAGNLFNPLTNRHEGFVATIPSPPVAAIFAAAWLVARRRRG